MAQTGFRGDCPDGGHKRSGSTPAAGRRNRLAAHDDR